MKIAWSIDPFDKNDDLILTGSTIINSLNPDYIEVVYVASPTETGLSLAFEIPEPQRFTEYPRLLLQDKLSEFNVHYDKITVVKVQSTSKNDQVVEYTNYLKSNQFDFVVLATHARTGIERFFQGSFSEAMILNAKTNLIIFNPRDKASPEIKRLMFGHDLSKTATEHLKKVDRLAHDLGAKVDVVYVSEPILNYSETSAMMYAKSYRKVIDDKIDYLKEEINQVDPKIDLYIEDTWDSISELIIKRSDKNKSDMIVVNSKVGSFVAALGGSISRQVVRHAHQPVMVLVN